jgi:alpha-tubulin suppressor-like RCC1 family protein
MFLKYNFTLRKILKLKTMKTIYLLICFLLTYLVGSTQCWNKFSGGSYQSIALKSDGTMWGFGKNGGGIGWLIGSPTPTYVKEPTQIGNMSDWSSVGSGSEFNVALKTDGTLWAWGYNAYGQLGDGTTINKNSPIQIGTDTNWSKIAVGYNYCLALKTNGTLWAWGNNGTWQLGDGTKVNKNIPTQIGTATDWSQIAAGSAHSMAIKSNGTLWAWGYNNAGQVLGTSSTANVPSPTQVGSATNWSKVAVANSQTMAIKTNGTLWGWGYNFYGEMGNGTQSQNILMTQIGTETNWSDLSLGENHSIALKSNGTLWGWGRNQYGQLGNNLGLITTTPTQLNTTSNFTAISAGLEFSLASTSDNNLWGWGRNDMGQVGNGTLTQANATIVSCNTLSLLSNNIDFIKIFPNPTNSFIIIQNPEKRIINYVIITDLNGRKVKEQSQDTNKIDVHYLNSGIYLLQINAEGKNSIHKFIKN